MINMKIGQTPDIAMEKPRSFIGEIGNAAMAATVYGLSNMLGGKQDAIQAEVLRESRRDQGTQLARFGMAA